MIDPGYRVHVLPGALDAVGGVARVAVRAHRYAIVTDSNVGPLYAAQVEAALAGLAAHVFTIRAGETHKTRDTWTTVTDQMLDAGFGRDSAVIALGGGVVGDLAGFVAATFMRGIPFIQMPTSLLAMLDASIGGKTGVDTRSGKNLVGAFHQPSAVIIDPAVLATLPRNQFRSGLSEALKHGVIADRAHFNAVAALAAEHRDRLPDLRAVSALIARSVEIKSAVVAARHARGGATQDAELRPHARPCNRASQRIPVAARRGRRHRHVPGINIAERAGVAVAGTADRIRTAVEAAGLPTQRPADLEPAAILQATHGDKKGRRGRAEYALPVDLGRMAFDDRGWSAPMDDRWCSKHCSERRGNSWPSIARL